MRLMNAFNISGQCLIEFGDLFLQEAGELFGTSELARPSERFQLLRSLPRPL